MKKIQKNHKADQIANQSIESIDCVADQKRTYDFKIAGVSYKIKSSHDEKTVNELVSFVNERVTEALSATKNSSFQNAAVLAALNIAEEMILLKRKAQNELDKLEHKAQRIVQDLENSKTNKVINLNS